ncbi:Glutathione reductase, chloroplastic [Auxenochlorella protothecoides]|uniref:glutathione-disulfide reductase n=1 Tax=Auxenochlorella protothecoides TaxID=3075 RepID=A0A087SNB9_AUXPR|nr:Glutathione reductase, chloroplastic [Auxenochlorella protothecoides]KFM27223.1 Glutathione reductase, chloroplastic [Auxenochlorella protothecoides]RMZ57093.1 hypothetical protein APUTEX25_002325 [Auxenochlorella protothecoides]|eukprot:RMZ57093.1 hypothetical protein APUTEX25_002325 [Auxenochlorella protothecoides]
MSDHAGEDGFEYDLVTIGAGSGGVRASRLAASKYGRKVAVIELPFGFVSDDSTGGAGGTCVIRGCVPKKLLVYASEFADGFRAAQGFGWGAASPPVDIKQLIARKGKEIQRLNGVYTSILKNAGVEQIEGRGVVLDPHTVEVRAADGSVRRLRTANILVATGGRAVKIPVEGKEHAITSDEALVLDEYPDTSIAVIGGGYIAVEFAGIFKGLGADVHLMYRAPLPLRAFDDECRSAVAENLELRGIHVHSECNPTSIEKEGEGRYVLHYRDGSGQEHTLRCGKVMMATGRRANTRGIGLEDAGVELAPKSQAIVVDEFSRTSVPSIWAIGDVTDRVALTPVALMEGRALVETLFGGRDVAPDYANIASAVFAQPPLATVGLSEKEAQEKLSGEVDVYVSKFRPMKNTLSGAEEKTFMKMLVHVESDKVVGCHMVGPDAAEIMQGLGIALKCGATKAQFDATVGIHPSSAEEWVTMGTPSRWRIKCGAS